MRWGYIIGTLVVLLVILFGGWLVVKAIECYEKPKTFILAATALIYWSIIIGSLVKLKAEENAKGPCVEYKTQMHYNAATKTMMPAKVCVNRGEWVNE